MHQIMADLPALRFKATAPFKAVSIDMFGPFKVRLGTTKTRGAKSELRYGAIFTCLVTRAVHLVVTESLSTAHFLNALRTMESVRGRPDLLYSDNGKGFVGSIDQIKPTIERLYEDIEESVVVRGIRWQRYTPHAPHMGGVHEALVRSTKRALHAVLDFQPSLITDLELVTLFAETTAMLNSRPLSYTSSDVNDQEVLTPNSFLLPKATFELHPNLQNATIYQGSYRRMQALMDQVWKRWMTEYLPALTTRAKWQWEERDVKVNDAVLLIEPNLPRNRWRIGRVVEIHPGNKGHVRAVTVLTPDQKTHLRPIVKCCLLEPAEEILEIKCHAPFPQVPELHGGKEDVAQGST